MLTRGYLVIEETSGMRRECSTTALGSTRWTCRDVKVSDRWCSLPLHLNTITKERIWISLPRAPCSCWPGSTVRFLNITSHILGVEVTFDFEIDFSSALQSQEFTTLFVLSAFSNFEDTSHTILSDMIRILTFTCVPLSRAAILLHTLVLSPFGGVSEV